MELKTTSKTSVLTALLLRAWRERWTDLQWGINIKTVLPRGVSGDVYNLADCIMQQAVVGSGANQLMLSYLKHSLSAQVVSHAAVLAQIAKYDQFQKTHCVGSLLNFLEGIQPGVSCCGKSEETKLAVALLSIANWLLQIVQQVSTLQQKAETLLQSLIANHMSMLYLARYADTEKFVEVKQRCRELETTHPYLQPLLKTLKQLQPTPLSTANATDAGPGCLIQAWLSVKLVSNLSCSPTSLAAQLRLLQRLSGMSDSRLAAEVLRGGLLSLCGANQTAYEVQWGAFTFLKLPKVLEHLKLAPGSVYSAVENLLVHSPLLDAIDAHASSSSLEWLLGELLRVQLLTEPQVAELNARRQPNLGPTFEPRTGIPRVIVHAVNTSAGILKTLTADNPKTQDALLGMLHKVLARNSFELILAVATVQGQLGVLMQRLIRFNECSKLATDSTRAQLFDISFLILVVIVQNYGVSTALGLSSNSGLSTSTQSDLGQSGGAGSADGTLNASGSALNDADIVKDSLLERWATVCMVEAERAKHADDLLKLSDKSTVDRLLKQFNAGESADANMIASSGTGSGSAAAAGDAATVAGIVGGATGASGAGGATAAGGTVDWGQMVFSMAGVMKEVLVAWEQGALFPSDVKRILDAVRGRMCCLPLAAAAWLCAYMRTAPQDALLKPGNMLLQLMAPPALAAEDQCVRERWQLTSDIIRCMQTDCQLVVLQVQRCNEAAPAGDSADNSSDRHLVSRHPATEKLHDVWLGSIERGWLDNESARSLHCLIATAGARWYVMATLQEVLQLKYRDELAKGCDLALAACHVDIRRCCIELLTRSLPQLLYNNLQSDALTEPKLSTIALLCARIIYAAMDDITSSSCNADACDPQTSSTTTLSSMALLPPPSKKAKSPSTEEILLGALKDLLLSLEQHLQEGYITQQTYFTFYLLRNLVELSHSTSPGGRTVLSAVPTVLVSQLLRTLPEMFTSGLLEHFYDVNTVVGRANMARDLCAMRSYQLRHA